MRALKSKPEPTPRTALPILLQGLFDPRPGENFAVLCDANSTGPAVTEGGGSRQSLAESWRLGLLELGVRVPEVFTFVPPSPESQIGEDAGFRALFRQTSCALVFTHLYDPDRWRPLLAQYPDLRIALLPGTSRQMEQTAWQGDATDVSRRVARCTELLRRSLGVRIHFSTGQQAYFDLRFQNPSLRMPNCHAGASDRLATLPGGEAWTTTYAGDGADPWCDTIGILPFYQDGLLYQYFVEKGQITGMIGDGAVGDGYRAWLEANPGQRLISRLGFGCNARASVGRGRMEARTAGFYWSIDPVPGSMDTVQADSQPGRPPSDYFYANGQPVIADEVTVTLEDTSEVLVVENGRVVV